MGCRGTFNICITVCNIPPSIPMWQGGGRVTFNICITFCYISLSIPRWQGGGTWLQTCSTLTWYPRPAMCSPSTTLLRCTLPGLVSSATVTPLSRWVGCFFHFMLFLKTIKLHTNGQLSNSHISVKDLHIYILSKCNKYWVHIYTSAS